MISGVKSSSDDTLSAIDSVEGDDLAVLGAVAQIEVIRADRIALGAYAEELGLDAILHVGVVDGEYLVERLLEQTAVTYAVYGRILRAVVYPDVEHGGVALTASHLLGDLAAAFRVLDPEAADAFIGVREGEHAALGVRERGRVEVEFHAVGLGPVHPAGEVFGTQRVAVDGARRTEIGIACVQAQAVAPRYERRGGEDILTQLLDVARLTRVVARGLNAARKLRVGVLEARDVIGLPAVQRE